MAYSYSVNAGVLDIIGSVTLPIIRSGNIITDSLTSGNLSIDILQTSNIQLSGNLHLINYDNNYPDIGFNGIYRSITGTFPVSVYESVNDTIINNTILRYSIINNLATVTIEGFNFNLANPAFLYIPNLQVNQYLLTNKSITQIISVYVNGPAVSQFGRADLNDLSKYLVLFSGPSQTDLFPVTNCGFNSFSFNYYL